MPPEQPTFEHAVTSCYEPLYRFALGLSRSEADAADLTQRAFERFGEKSGMLRDPAKAKTWLFTTLHREFLNQRRRASRFSDEPLDEAAMEASVGSEEDAERHMDGNRAMELLGRLDETYRAPVALFYLQQHSYKEIAEILDIPIGTVMSRLSRGKEMLRRQMTAEPSSAPKNILNIDPGGLRHG